MRFDAKKPCATCPFRRDVVGFLHPLRAKQIGLDMALIGNNSMFQCHKTLKRNAAHCTGALIFAEKQGVFTLPMQIAERMGLYRPRSLMHWTRREIHNLVFDSVDEMSAHHGRTP